MILLWITLYIVLGIIFVAMGQTFGLLIVSAQEPYGKPKINKQQDYDGTTIFLNFLFWPIVFSLRFVELIFVIFVELIVFCVRKLASYIN